MNKRFYISALAALIGLSPLIANAQLQQNGLFNCNQTGAYAMSVGTLGAVGGSYVPVFDNAVTINTGYLVYKECVLRPVIDAERKQATAAYQQLELNQLNTGNNGNPYFVQNFGQEQASVGDQAFRSSFAPVTSRLNPAFAQSVDTSLARNYAARTQAPYMSLSCPYQGNWGNVMSGNPQYFSWGAVFDMANPSCDPVFAYSNAQQQLYANAAAAENAWLTQLNWGQGIYPITNANGLVVTPGVLAGAVAAQALTSGYRQLENATDVGQMVGALFAGVGNQILSNAGGGLIGLGASIGGQPSYFSQVAQEASQGLSQAVTSTALSVLGPMLAVEQNFFNVQNAIANNLLQTTNQLRGAENACWVLIIQKVCSATSTSASTGGCTSSSGAQIRIATSTAFSQPIIDTQIAPIANVVINNASTSRQSVQILQGLTAAVQNAGSPDAQKSALQQVDALVASGLLHTQADLDRANQNLQDVQSATQKLAQDTIHLWAGDGADGTPGANAWDGSTGSGWCNVNKQETIDKWVQKWSATGTTR